MGYLYLCLLTITDIPLSVIAVFFSAAEENPLTIVIAVVVAVAVVVLLSTVCVVVACKCRSVMPAIS